MPNPNDIKAISIIRSIDTNSDNKISQDELENAPKTVPSIWLEQIGDMMDGKESISVDTVLTGLGIEHSESDEAENIDEQDNEEFFPYEQYSQPITKIKSLDEIPTGSHDNIKDARDCDISCLNLTKEQLLNLTIDKTTVMSEEQRAIINEYTEKMKDPGLGIRALHEQGFTGKGVKMAIIDQPLGEHQEYSDNIAEHHDINCDEIGWTNASMHGAAVTSIAAGKTTGVAPDASVNYYSAVNLTKDPKDIELYRTNILNEIANNQGNEKYIKKLQDKLDKIDPKFGVSSNVPYVEALNRILDENEKLPQDERVSVVSISWGFDKFAPGYEELQQALARAKEQGVFIVSTALDEHYGMDTCGANRNPEADPDNSESYEAGAFWKDDTEPITENKDKFLLIPMDHRTVADYTDNSSYRYEGNDGGMSWSTPWLAGMYVLAKQANPDITPEEFWEKALETSDECKNNDSGEYVGRLINPQKLIDAVKA